MVPCAAALHSGRADGHLLHVTHWFWMSTSFNTTSKEPNYLFNPAHTPRGMATPGWLRSSAAIPRLHVGRMSVSGKILLSGLFFFTWVGEL